MTRYILVAIVIFCPLFSLDAQSPYTTSWEKDAWIVSGGGAISITGFFLYRSVSPLTAPDITSLSRESVNSFDRGAISHFSGQADKTSDILYGIATAAPFLLFTNSQIRDDWQTITLMYLETWSFIGGTSMLSKGLIKRYRPFVYNPDVPIEEKLTSDARMSFFSNHTATAFASAVFLSTIYSDYQPDSRWRPYIWAGSLLTAGYVGYLRYEAGMHFPTDIVVGAIVGSAIGYMIPWMHRVHKDDITLIPRAQYPSYGFSMQIRF